MRLGSASGQLKLTSTLRLRASGRKRRTLSVVRPSRSQRPLSQGRKKSFLRKVLLVRRVLHVLKDSALDTLTIRVLEASVFVAWVPEGTYKRHQQGAQSHRVVPHRWDIF